MKIILIILLTAVIVSCDRNPYNCSIDNLVLSKNDSIMQLPTFKAGFTPVFEANSEPALETIGKKSFRLLVYYSWDREAWIYRFVKSEHGGMLIIKKTYTESYKKNSNFSDTTIHRKLSIEKWNEVERIFNANCFWTLACEIDLRGLDGTNCVLEAYDPARQNPIDKEYFVAWRWSPEKNTEFRKICDFIESFEPD